MQGPTKKIIESFYEYLCDLCQIVFNIFFSSLSTLLFCFGAVITGCFYNKIQAFKT